MCTKGTDYVQNLFIDIQAAVYNGTTLRGKNGKPESEIIESTSYKSGGKPIEYSPEELKTREENKRAAMDKRNEIIIALKQKSSPLIDKFELPWQIRKGNKEKEKDGQDQTANATINEEEEVIGQAEEVSNKNPNAICIEMTPTITGEKDETENVNEKEPIFVLAYHKKVQHGVVR